jgi:hypothetical protein
MSTWTIEKIKEMINNQIEENINLDYKAAAAITDDKEMAKDVSAFANSDGGTIIYGVKEFNDKSKRHIPEAIDPIDARSYSKEKLEQKINSNISPRISGILITPIRLNSTSLETIYVVEIPKSDTAHQSKLNFRYHRRFNFLSEPMHDYEIRDIMNRKTTPKIQLSFRTVSHHDDNGNITYSTTILASNEGGILAKYLKVYLYVPIQYVERRKLLKYSQSTINEVDCNIFEFQNIPRVGVGASLIPSNIISLSGSTHHEPILPGMKVELGEFPCVEPVSVSGIILFATVHVDNVQPVKSEYQLINSDFQQIKQLQTSKKRH